MRPMTGRQSGFTLIEMLVATAMTALLAGSLYASLYIAFRARHTAVAATDTIRFGTQAMAIIESDLKSAPNPNGILVGPFTGQSAQTLGTSGADDLVFYSALSEYSPLSDNSTLAGNPALGGNFALGGNSPSAGNSSSGGSFTLGANSALTAVDPPVGSAEIKKIEYTLVKAADSDQMVLVRNVTDNLLAQVEPDPRQEIICRGVHSFSMQYYDGTTWQTDWDSTQQDNNLPIAVQVTIQLDSPDKNALSASPDKGGLSSLTRTIMLPCCRLTPTTEGSQ